jgi:cold shock protein
MARGTVKWFNSQKGYGFIQPQGGGGRDVFVHISAVEKAGLPGLNEGQVIEYEEVTNRGKTSAKNSRPRARIVISLPISVAASCRKVVGTVWPGRSTRRFPCMYNSGRSAAPNQTTTPAAYRSRP